MHIPQIAEPIEAGCTFKSYVIIRKNRTKAGYCGLEIGFSGKESWETKWKKKQAITKNIYNLLQQVPG